MAFWSAVEEANRQEQLAKSEADDIEAEVITSDESDTDGDNDDAGDDVTDQELGSNLEGKSSQDEAVDDAAVDKATVSDTAVDDTTVDHAAGSPLSEATQLPSDITERADSADQLEAGTSRPAADGSRIRNKPSLLCGHDLIEVFKSLHDYTSNDKRITTVGLVGADIEPDGIEIYKAKFWFHNVQC